MRSSNDKKNLSEDNTATSTRYFDLFPVNYTVLISQSIFCLFSRCRVCSSSVRRFFPFASSLELLLVVLVAGGFATHFHSSSFAANKLSSIVGVDGGCCCNSEDVRGTIVVGIRENIWDSVLLLLDLGVGKEKVTLF